MAPAAVSRPAQPQHTALTQAAAKAAEPASAPTPQAAASTSGQQEAADAAMYREMRTALCDFDSAGSPKDSPPRHRAFFTALQSVLGQVLEEKTAASRHVRLLAAHQWYVKHKPRPQPADMDMAAAMAASLSVQTPTDDVTALASPVCARAASPVGSAAGRKQQKQQPFHVLGAQQELFYSCAAEDAERQQGVCRTTTSRWREQQALRLHELEDEGSIATALGSNNSQAGALDTNRSTGSEPARPARCFVTACLPEQPSLRAVPAIQAVSTSGAAAGGGGFSTGAMQGLGITPRAGSKPGAAATAGRPGPNGKTAAATAAAPLPPPDGLIPVGSLPSSRFLSGSGSGRSGGCGGSSYDVGFAQLRAVTDQQQQVQDTVAAHMRGYARHRARLEEEINRKQEVAMQLAAMQHKLQNTGHGSVCGATVGACNRPAPARALLHIDSQHQPSQVETAYTGLDANAGWVQRLAPVDKVKEVKQALLQDSQRECAAVTAHITKLGIAADADVVRHALLPLPDKPYMTCMAQLPKPGRRSSSTATKIKDKKKTKLGKKGTKAFDKIK